MFGIDNPDTLLRPWASLKQFSEELYSAFVRGKEPSTPQTPAATQPAPNQEPIQARRVPDYGQATPSLRARPTPSVETLQQQIAGAQVAVPERGVAPTPAVRAPREPVVATQPTPAQRQPRVTPVQTPDQVSSPIRTPAKAPDRRDEDLGQFPEPPVAMPQGAYPSVPGDGGGAGSYMGQVLSFSGGGSDVDSSSSVLVQLYSAGPNAAPDSIGPNGEDSGIITVGILQFLGSDNIPEGYWISGIIPSTDGVTYSAQVPVWS